MKKGICLGCLPGGSAEEKFRLAKDAGYDGVEIGSVKTDDEVLKLKELADKAGVEIPSIMGGSHWQFPLSSPDPEVRKKCSDSFKTDLRHAAMIGAKTVLCVPAVVTPEVTYEQAYERSQAEIREIAKVAEEYQVALSIENVWNKFLLSPMEFVRYIDEIGSPFVKAYFDCGNICLYGFPQQWIRTIGSARMDKIHVKGFTFKDRKADFPPTLISDVPWKACREAWLEIGYDDYLTVEIGPRKEDPVQSVRDYSAELSRIIAGEV